MALCRRSGGIEGAGSHCSRAFSTRPWHSCINSLIVTLEGFQLGVWGLRGQNFDLLGGRVYALIHEFTSFPPGDYIFELQATDNQGNKSFVFPYFEVGE